MKLLHHIIHKFTVKKKLKEYYQLLKDFNEKTLKMGYGDLKNYYWYHTIDLGNGLVTPGCHDYRSSLSLFKFPTNMDGMNVLDIGAATGFFSFEFERRGANVVSVELPSIVELDRFPGESTKEIMKKFEKTMLSHYIYTSEQLDYFLRVSTIEELNYFHLHAPFEFCRKVLNSKVKRCYSTIYDLSPEELGITAFDLVFIGDILLHTIEPLKALASVVPLCRGTLVISQAMPNIISNFPVMLYVGGEKPGEDDLSWWWPNRLCFTQLLKKLGFKNVCVVGNHAGILRPSGAVYDRAIIHARK